jgi:hypothetical protein
MEDDLKKKDDIFFVLKTRIMTSRKMEDDLNFYFFKMEDNLKKGKRKTT